MQWLLVVCIIMYEVWQKFEVNQRWGNDSSTSTSQSVHHTAFYTYYNATIPPLSIQLYLFSKLFFNPLNFLVYRQDFFSDL